MKFNEQQEFKDKKGIYAIINCANDFIYIGQTRQKFNKRYWHHRWKLRDNSHDNPHLQNAWNVYGESSFEFIVIECIENNEELNSIEEGYIEYFKELDCCYNISDDNQPFSSYVRTEEHKRSIGEKNRINMLGRKHSEITKKRMSDAHKGKHYNEINYKITKAQAFTIKKSLINGIEATDIAEELGISYKIVNNILSNDSWSRVYVDGWEDFKSNRAIRKRLSDEECVEIYNLYQTGSHTQQEIANIYNKSRHTIANAIKKIKNSK